MNYLDGCDVLGADKVYTDKATIKSVQTRLHAFAQATNHVAFDPGKIDGILGPNTKAALAAFNTTFGWPTDGATITDGTLEALKRPDVTDPQGYAASQADGVQPQAAPQFMPTNVLHEVHSVLQPGSSVHVEDRAPFAAVTGTSWPWGKLVALVAGAAAVIGGLAYVLFRKGK